MLTKVSKLVRILQSVSRFHKFSPVQRDGDFSKVQANHTKKKYYKLCQLQQNMLHPQASLRSRRLSKHYQQRF